MKRFPIIMVCMFAVLAFVCDVTFGAQVGLQWDPNDPAPEGYRVFERDEGGAYDYSTPRPVVGDPDGNIPHPTVSVQIDDIVAPPGVLTVKYWVVRAYDGTLESADSEEVTWSWDRTLPETPTTLVASYDRALSEVSLTWNQADPTEVAHWDIFYTETSGSGYAKLDTVQNTGQGTPSLTTPITIVAPGERKTIYFTVVAFRDAEVFTPNSAEVSVDINRTVLQPPSGVSTFAVTIPVQ